jgi:catechol 2,3-dioxygenase-like lactoylglutathione lyase family enzyme
MNGLRVCIDVPDLERGIAFYAGALGLRPGRRAGRAWVELLGGPCPVDLLAKDAGTPASPAADAVRGYARHWTPVHLDVVVDDLDGALRRACEAGAVLERDVRAEAWGRMANLADPFGHGFCLLEFRGRGYDEVLEPPP